MSTNHPLTDEYLGRLQRAASRLPRRERHELLAEIRAHLAAGLRPGATEADVRNMLDDLGDPAEIVRAAERDTAPPPRRGAREAFAIVLLVAGGLILPIAGWLLGVALLLSSPLWTGRQKVLGILVWPGGLAYIWLIPLTTGGTTSVSTLCTTPFSEGAPSCATSTIGPSIWESAVIPALGVLLVVSQIVVAAYLYRAAGRQPNMEHD